MDRVLRVFETIARKTHKFTEVDSRDALPQHPFDKRNMHENLPQISRDLFDNGHYAQATFEAFKYIDKLIQVLSGSSESGVKCVMRVFAGDSPNIVLTPNKTISEKDEQKGFQFLFAGSILAIRNPRGHEISISDSPDTCLDHLALASMLLRRLEEAGYNVEMI